MLLKRKGAGAGGGAHPALEVYQRRFELIKERNRRMIEQEKLNLLKGEFGASSRAVKHHLAALQRAPPTAAFKRAPAHKSLTPMRTRLQKLNAPEAHARAGSTSVAPYLQPRAHSGAKYFSNTSAGAAVATEPDTSSPRHPILKEASKLIRCAYKPGAGGGVARPGLGDIRAQRDSHILTLRQMSELNPRLRGFFWAPDLSYAAFAPPQTIKETREKWDMDESRLDLSRSPESNVVPVPPRSEHSRASHVRGD